MNRKGHIGTLLLVVGALILVTTALYSFYSFGGKVKLKDSEFKGLSLEAKQNNFLIKEGVNKIVLGSIVLSKNSVEFELAFNNSLRTLAQNERISDKYTDNNVFAKLANLDYSLINNGFQYTLEVNGLFYKVKSSDSLNIINRDFGLKIVFTKEKVVSVDYI